MCSEKGDVCGKTEGFWGPHRSTRPTGSLVIFIIKLTLNRLSHPLLVMNYVQWCLVCDALKDSVHFLENGVVYVLFYQCILKLM